MNATGALGTAVAAPSPGQAPVPPSNSTNGTTSTPATTLPVPARKSPTLPSPLPLPAARAYLDAATEGAPTADDAEECYFAGGFRARDSNRGPCEVETQIATSAAGFSGCGAAFDMGPLAAPPAAVAAFPWWWIAAGVGGLALLVGAFCAFRRTSLGQRTLPGAGFLDGGKYTKRFDLEDEDDEELMLYSEKRELTFDDI